MINYANEEANSAGNLNLTPTDSNDGENKPEKEAAAPNGEETVVEPIEQSAEMPEGDQNLESHFDSDLGPIKEAVYLIEADKIKPNPHQPRRNFDEVGLKELADSIREYGILQPLIVVKVEKEVPSGTAVEYQLIAGERRLKAAQIIGLERVPAIVRQPLEERQNYRRQSLKMSSVWI